MTAARLPDRHAPDLVEPLVGYRHWALRDEALWSPFFDYRWERGVNTATCTCAGDHPESPPGRACLCGLHAWYRPCPRLGYAIPELVGGAVVLWGEVELHPTGMRASHAAVVALVLPLPGTRKRRRVIDVADAQEVDVVPARQLAATALRHGLPIATKLVPDARGAPGQGCA
jgi:hypothetical protein